MSTPTTPKTNKTNKKTQSHLRAARVRVDDKVVVRRHRKHARALVEARAGGARRKLFEKRAQRRLVARVPAAVEVVGVAVVADLERAALDACFFLGFFFCV